MAGALWFYHLERTGLEAALGPLLEKCLARGWRAIVRGGAAARLEELDVGLWTFRDDAFVPHGRAGKAEAAFQPVWLTEGLENPNGAKVLFAIDSAPTEDAAAFERACIVFDGRDEVQLANARRSWKAATAAGLACEYWREQPGRGWVKQAG